jgi:predicted transcriptional regulator
LKCVFHQPNKTQELYKILEQEEQELIAHYTSKNKEKELSFVKKQLKDWNTNGFINKSKTTAKRLIGGGASK